MVKFLDIAGKNLKTLFRNKKGFLFTLLFPILFYSVNGFILGGIDTTTVEYTYHVGWVDLDSSESGDAVKNLTYIYGVINDLDSIDLVVYESQESARLDLENQAVDAYIVFPNGYEMFLNGSQPHPTENVSIVYRNSASSVTRNIISNTIMGIIDGIVNFNPVALSITYEEDTIAGEEVNQITAGTPGYLIYGLLSALTGGIILITQERKEGLLKRLESSRVKPKDMFFGHLISNTVLIFLQFSIGILTLALFGFSPVYNDLFSLIVGVGIAVLLLSIFQNALALIVSSILKTPETAGGGVWVILIPLMMFSGAFFPLELIAPGVIPYVGWIPTRIGVLLFQDLMVNAIPVWDMHILLQFLWLALEGLALFFIGIKLYRNFIKS